MERAFHLPALEALHMRRVTFGSRLLAGLRARAARGEPAARAARVAATARRFLDPEDRWRRRALEALPGLTGFSPTMIEETLPRVFAPLTDAVALQNAASAGPVVG